ncbi:MAG: CD225/dispanin family protein [Phycisphaerae bacterium]|nr:CD225/dispanin family protein [Phycisphaerae bacterium]
MFCRNCGAVNDDNAFKCIQCGQVLQGTTAGPTEPVPNHLVPAILVTVFCCLPFGIVAIVYAASVNGKVQAGDYAGAVAASRNAAMWSWISFGVGLVVSIGWGLMSFLGAAASQM